MADRPAYPGTPRWVKAAAVVVGLLVMLVSEAGMLAGLPPGAAFLSKWRLLVGAAESAAWLAMTTLLLSTILNFAYFVPIIVRAFTGPAPAAIEEAPPAVLLPLLVTACAGLLLGLFPDAAGHLLALAETTAASVLSAP